jgi:hypothetical protein
MVAIFVLRCLFFESSALMVNHQINKKQSPSSERAGGYLTVELASDACHPAQLEFHSVKWGLRLSG